MTDAEYDILTQYVETRFPRSNAVQAIGALPVEKNKVRLPYEMASMDKIKPDTGALAQWKSTYTGPYVLSSKLDGVSGLFSTEDAAAPRLYTRGDGKIGQDISYLIPHLRLPTPAGAVVRGEFVFKKAVFADKYAAKYANARNLVAGLVNGKTLDDRIRDVDFVAYEVIRPASLTPSQQMAWLTEQGFQTVQNQTVPSDQLTNDQLSEHLREARANEVYDIDGIIVSDDRVYPRTSGNPDHSFAFKMVLSDQAAETHVTDVEWTASKDGFLKPTVHVEPVTIGGVTIRKTTGFNAEFIEKNRLGVGAIVRLIRSGDVIPYIQQVVQPATQAKMPTVPYVWNKTHIDILLENADEDTEVRKKRIVTFFKTLDVDGLREGNVQKIVQAGYDTICKIVHMTEADMLKVEGFKEKTAHKLVTGIREAVAKAPIPALMVASGTMGRGMGEKKMEVVFEAYPEWLEPQERNLERLAAIKGMSRTTAQDLIMRIPAFMAFLTECGITLPSAELGAAAAAAPVTGPSAATAAAADGPAITTSAATEALRNKTVVMTGVRSKELEAALKPLGVKFGSSVSKNTFALIVAAKGDALTGKMKDAQNLGVPMYTLEEFRTAFGIAA
jgi:NAD-dependent DNA ligase